MNRVDVAIGALVIGGVLAFIAGMTVVILAFNWHAEHVDCLRLHEQTSYPTHMVGTMWGGGCYINVDKRWIPDTRYRMVNVD